MNNIVKKMTLILILIAFIYEILNIRVQLSFSASNKGTDVEIGLSMAFELMGDKKDEQFFNIEIKIS